MPENIIRFRRGINTLENASIESPRDLKNARLEVFDELRSWRSGTFPFNIPYTKKPWFEIENNWWTGDIADHIIRYGDRIFALKNDGSDSGLGNYMYETGKDQDPYNLPLGFEHLRGYTPIVVNKPVLISGDIEYFSWASTDTNIKGITHKKAVDYVFIPIDRFGQSGPWVYRTFYNHFNGGLSGAILTAVPTFTISFANEYKQILVYRSLEYDLEGVFDEQRIETILKIKNLPGFAEDIFRDKIKDFTDSVSTVQEITGGYFLEDTIQTTTSFFARYKSEAYWPSNIFDEDSLLSDRVGVPLDRIKNTHAIFSTLINIETPGVTARTTGAKTGIIDAGTSIIGNVSIPTRTPVAAINEDLENEITTGINLSFQYEYSDNSGNVFYGPVSTSTSVKKIIIPWEGEQALNIWANLSVPIVLIIGGQPGEIVISGNWLKVFNDSSKGKKITIAGSTANDGDYTFVSALYNSSTNETVITIEEFTITEFASGNLLFSPLWERLAPDKNNKYISGIHQPFSVKKQYTTIAEDPIAFYTTYTGSEVFPLGPEPVTNYIKMKNMALLSAPNAPWEITLDNFSIPGSSEIRAITPAQRSDIEQIRAFGFYIFTDNGIFVGERQGRDVFLESVDPNLGIELGVDGQPIYALIRGGVVFYGTDKRLYVISSKNIQRIDFEIERAFNDVFDITYSTRDNEIWVLTDRGILVYDIDRGFWSGARESSVALSGFQDTFLFTQETPVGIGGQIGATIPITRKMVIKRDGFIMSAPPLGKLISRFVNFVVFALADSLVLDLLVDRPPSTTETIARIELNRIDPGTDNIITNENNFVFEVKSGLLLLGDVVLNPGDSVRLVVANFDTSIFSNIPSAQLFVRGIQVNEQESLTIKRIGYSESLDVPLIGYENEAVEFWDNSGLVIPGSAVTMQPIRTTFETMIDGIKLDYDGVVLEGTYTADHGSNTITLTSGTFDAARDTGAMISLENAGESQDGNPVTLVCLISEVLSPTEAVISDFVRVPDLYGGLGTVSGTAKWTPPAFFEIDIDLESTHRSRKIGPFIIQPYRTKRPKNMYGRNITININNFDKLREIYILSQSQNLSD